MIAAGEGRGVRAALREQVAAVRGGQRGEDRQPERAPYLGGGVDQAGGETGVSRPMPDMATFISAGKQTPAPMPSSSIEGITWTK